MKSEILAVIPWNKMEQRMFGINQHGIVSVSRDTGKVRLNVKESFVCVRTS